MIFAVMGSENSEEGPWVWLSGVFTDKREAQAYVDKMPMVLRSTQNIFRFSDLEFPLYLIESPYLMKFVNAKKLKKFLKSMRDHKKFKQCTIYKLEAPWQPSIPGTDEMGKLYHVHIDEEELECFMRSGLKGIYL